MADERPADDPALAVAARHALHDEELIAAFAAGAAEGDDAAARARSLIDRCATCAELAHDIEAITGAVRGLDSAAAAATYVKAPRDFRIRPQDVGLRPANPLARVAAAVFGGVSSFGRPVGATLATFGLVGLLIGTVGLGPIGTPASAPAVVAPTSASEGPVDAGSAEGNVPDATGTSKLEFGPLATGGDEGTDRSTLEARDGRPSAQSVAFLVAASIALLVAGLALLAANARTRGRAGAPRT